MPVRRNVSFHVVVIVERKPPSQSVMVRRHACVFNGRLTLFSYPGTFAPAGEAGVTCNVLPLLRQITQDSIYPPSNWPMFP